MRRCVERLLAAAVAALLSIGVGAAESTESSVPRLSEREALRAGDAAIGSLIPEMTLADRQRRPVRLSSYRGKPLLVSFIYTACFEVCPTQTRALFEAVKGLDRLLGPDQFNIVSIGFNQPFDGPDELRAFAAQHRIQHRNWEFLAPPRAEVGKLTEAFGFSYVATPAGFDHVLGVTVVDGEGRIRAQVYGDKLRADQLGAPLRALLLDAPVITGDAPGTVLSLVERVRILCTVYDPDTGTYRYDYKLIFMLVGGILFFLTTLIYLGLEWRDQRRARRNLRGTPSCPPPTTPATTGAAG
jgi:protein SCO1/2